MRSQSKKTGKPPNARENTGKKVTFSFRLASEWFRAWREFLDQSQTKEREPKKSRITLTLNSQLVGKFTTLKPRVSRCYSIPPPPPKKKNKKQKTKNKRQKNTNSHHKVFWALHFRMFQVDQKLFNL